jgi:uncharacterized membrane protein YgdD (TMEM256/DUF423 family)
MTRTFLFASGALGLCGVALGAFGAHGLARRFASLPDAAKRMEWWHTATLYHLVHALAVGLVAFAVARAPSAAATVAGWSFVAGVAIFSGSLYAMSVTGLRALGAVTPIGGVCFLVGWAALVWAALRLPA